MLRKVVRSRGELGDFLRSRREALSPEAVGLPPGRRRRTPGLRREEVAELAGIGVDWYVRIEQGRSVTPSLATIEALARALRLPDVDRAHLHALARGGESRVHRRRAVPDNLRRIVESLDQPAYVTDPLWDVLAWNRAADEMFAFGRTPEAERNTLASMMANPATRRLFGAGWAQEARRMVALFRASYDLHAGDPAFVGLVGRLRAQSPEFSRWWRAHEVRAPAAGHKSLTHPKKGAVRLAYATFQSNDDPALKLTIYAPAPA
ncbi:MAG TPA: helix-turn-helix transcriptional regulator [Rhodoblastus sp.]|nr:helix-turn-helix transcriptional regulator [Rhodoblastus sp.]